MTHGWAALAPALLAGALAATSRGQELVAPREVDEGRPVTIRVTWTQPAGAPALVTSLVATVGEVRASLPAAQEVRVVPLAPLSPDLVSLEVVAEEELGAAARAPRPPVRATLAGEPWLLARQLVPDERLVLEVPLVPVAGEPLAVTLTAEVVHLDPARGGPSLAECRVRGAARTWAAGPGGPAGEEDPLGLRPDAEAAGAAPESGPGGEGSPAVRVTLVRWVPAGPGPAVELLVRASELATPRAGSERLERRLAERVVVRPAPFGRAAAYARAGVAASEQAVRVGDLWALDAAGQVVVVGAEGEVVRADGALGGWGLRLARDGRATATAWIATDTPLAAALRDAGLVQATGKGVVVEVAAASLATFVRLVRDHHARLREGTVVEGR